MRVIRANGVALHWREDGEPNGIPVLFANSLGTDLRLWDAILPLLPSGYRFIRFDKRGHGLSECPDSPYSMDALVADAEALLDALGVRNAVVVGLSIGGLIAQGLAAKRPDRVRALVLSNTAAKIGTSQMWNDRIAAIESGGIEALSAAIIERWFGQSFRESLAVEPWRAMLERTPKPGYLGCCAAIAAADFTTSTSELQLPAMAIAGSVDGATPPELVSATAALIPNAKFHVIEGAGHLPCVEAPEQYAVLLTDFLRIHAVG